MRLSAAFITAPFAFVVLLSAPLLPPLATPLAAREARQAKPSPTPLPDEAQAPAWILMDPATGRVLESKNPHQRMFPASTTKTMTALVALSSGKMDQVVTIGPNPPKTGEQSINLMQGEQFVLRDLVRAALIKSANDACVAVAEGVAGDVPSFVKMMNAKAKEIGANDTHFCNPHGLHDPQHYTTAYDLALIARAAMQYPEFNEIIRTQKDSVHGNWKLGPLRPLVNRNRLLFRWAQCDGVKTGYTRQAGRCLIASATQNDPVTKQPWRLLSVVLHAPNSWQDSQVLLAKHGFARYLPFLAARSGEAVGREKITDAAADVEAMLPENALLTLRRGEESALTHEVKWKALTAPVAAGQDVGTLNYYIEGRKIAVVPVVAREAVPVSPVARVLPVAASVFPFEKFPLRFAVPTLLALGGMLLLGGLKLHGDEKKQRAARRRPRGGPQAGQHRKERANPIRADVPQVEPPARPQTHNPANRQTHVHTPHSRAARQANHARHSAPGSIHTERHHKAHRHDARVETDDYKQPGEPCAGEQFVTRFLAEEAESRDLAHDQDFSQDSDLQELVESSHDTHA